VFQQFSPHVILFAFSRMKLSSRVMFPTGNQFLELVDKVFIAW
jgi:hypothetical protein